VPGLVTIGMATGSTAITGTKGPLGASPAISSSLIRPPTLQGPMVLRRIGVVRPNRVEPRAVKLGMVALGTPLATCLSILITVAGPWVPRASGGGKPSATRYLAACLNDRCLGPLRALRRTWGDGVSALITQEVAFRTVANTLAPQAPLQPAGSFRGRTLLAGSTCRTLASATAPRPSRPRPTRRGAAEDTLLTSTYAAAMDTQEAPLPLRRAVLWRIAGLRLLAVRAGSGMPQFGGAITVATRLGQVTGLLLLRQDRPKFKGCRFSLGRRLSP
jgi:hypothetical protein